MPEGTYNYSIRTNFEIVEVEGTGIETDAETGALTVKNGDQDVAFFASNGFSYWTRENTA